MIISLSTARPPRNNSSTARIAFSENPSTQLGADSDARDQIDATEKFSSRNLDGIAG